MTQAIKIIKGRMMENHQNPKRQNDIKYPKILKDGMTKTALEILKDGTTFWGIFCYSAILSLRILGRGGGGVCHSVLSSPSF